MGGREEPPDVGADVCDAALDFINGDVVDVVFWEVDGGFEVGDHGEAAVAHGLDAAGEMAREMAFSDGEGAVGAGADDVHDGLRLREVEAAGEERALREFAALGQAGAVGEHEAEHAAEHGAAAVALELDDVFARVGVRRAHDEGDGFVDGLGMLADNVPIDGAAARGFRERRARGGGKDAVRDRERLCAADADDADARRARRRRDGGDGVLI